MTDIFSQNIVRHNQGMFQFHFQYLSIVKIRFISYTQVQFDDQVGRFIFHTNEKHHFLFKKQR